MKYHLSLSLGGALRMSEKEFYRQFKGCIHDDDGRLMLPSEARKKFQALVSQGIKLIPYDKCDNFDEKDKGCRGHLEPNDAPKESAPV